MINLTIKNPNISKKVLLNECKNKGFRILIIKLINVRNKDNSIINVAK